MKNNKKVIPVKFNCKVNQSSFAIDGNIEVHNGLGICKATPVFNRSDLPVGFQPELLSYVAITGYASGSLIVGNAQNPFSDEHTDFEVSRTLDLGSIGQLETNYYSEHRGSSKEFITFNVSGQVELNEKIVSISPVSELWRPSQDKNSFQGEMTFTWHLENGKTISGFAQSVYKIASAIKLTREQLRLITFELNSSADNFVQDEKIKLHDLEEWNSLVAI